MGQFAREVAGLFWHVPLDGLLEGLSVSASQKLFVACLAALDRICRLVDEVYREAEEQDLREALS